MAEHRPLTQQDYDHAAYLTELGNDVARSFASVQGEDPPHSRELLAGAIAIHFASAALLDSTQEVSHARIGDTPATGLLLGAWSRHRDTTPPDEVVDRSLFLTLAHDTTHTTDRSSRVKALALRMLYRDYMDDQPLEFPEEPENRSHLPTHLAYSLIDRQPYPHEITSSAIGRWERLSVFGAHASPSSWLAMLAVIRHERDTINAKNGDHRLADSYANHKDQANEPAYKEAADILDTAVSNQTDLAHARVSNTLHNRFAGIQATPLATIVPVARIAQEVAARIKSRDGSRQDTDSFGRTG